MIEFLTSVKSLEYLHLMQIINVKTLLFLSIKVLYTIAGGVEQQSLDNAVKFN